MDVVGKDRIGTRGPAIKIESLFYRFPLLSCFDSFEAMSIASYTEKKVIRRNEIIPKSNNRAYFVLSGRFGTFYSHPTGTKDFLVREYLVGDCVDLQSLLDMEPSAGIVKALEPSEVLSISKTHLHRTVFNNSKAINTAMILQSKMIRDISLVAAKIGLMDVRERLKDFIASRAIKEGDDFVYWDNISNRELGQRLGASREMINRLFKEFTNEGELISDGTSRLVLCKDFTTLTLS